MTVRTSYQGVAVEDVQPEVPARHPRWGYDAEKMAPLKGASLLLLADGTLVVVCDLCEYNGITGHEPYVKPEKEVPILQQTNSVMPHINARHHPNTNFPRYTDDQIRAAIKVWLKWKNTRVLGWVQHACDELEGLGFKPWLSDHWTRDKLGSLIRSNMSKSRFKDVEAGPMNDTDREALAALVRDAAARAGKDGTTVAGNARITEQKPPAHRHTPVDFAQIIASKGAVPAAQQKEDAPVPGPTLNFVGAGNGGADLLPVKSISLDKKQSAKPAPRMATKRGPAPEPAPAPVVAPSAQPVESDFEFIVLLADGPMFKYKGDLMVGKKVKGIEI